MEFVLLIVALALSGCLAGIRLGLQARKEAARLAQLNGTLELRVSERTRELQAALQTAHDQARDLEAASRARSDFLAAMSHELRTPLNAVIGFAELMRMNDGREPLTRGQSQAVDQILGSGRHLLALIEEVLDLASIEAGRLSMSMEKVDPQLVARQVCDTLRPRAEAAGVVLKAPPPTAGPGVVADPMRLRQILTSLVSNAIQYNRKDGEVLVEVRQTAGGVALSVHDTGVGIPDTRMEELFQPFNRLGRETSALAGAGIGLAVSRRLAEAMNGRLNAESREGEGSTFTLHLPRAGSMIAPFAGPDVPMGTLPAATLLYVEDNPSNIALMRHVIAALGPIRMHVAETGPEGLSLARDLKPDVILMDINLPGLSGFELKARLDADPLTWGIPTLALSASAMPQDIERGKAAGFRDYLTKPLDIARLADALNRALRSGEVLRSTVAA